MIQAAIRRLYEQYVDFMNRIAEARGRPVNVQSIEGFAHWWEGLDAETQARCRSDCEKGYDKARGEADAAIGQVIREHGATSTEPPGGAG